MQGDLLASILNPKDANELAFANVAHKAKLTTASHTTAPPLQHLSVFIISLLGEFARTSSLAPEELSTYQT